jgi:hypothetical protein
MTLFCMEEDEIERQLLTDTDSDCATDDSESDEGEIDSENEVDEEPSSSATWGPPPAWQEGCE